MTKPRSIVLALAIAAAGAAAAGTAQASPAGAARVDPVSTAGAHDGVEPAHHWRHRCRPVYRWVWTHWGWRYAYVGNRCRPPRYYWY